MRYQVRMHPTLDVLVSSVGEVFVPDSGTHKAHWTFGCKDSRGYLRVRINGKDYAVHRLIAGAFLPFLPNPEELLEVDHINRNKSDNRVENLRWCTPSQNCRNRRSSDRVDARGWDHNYEDVSRYNRCYHKDYYTNNRGECKEKQRQYNLNRSKTHKRVQFSDGSRHWVPLDEALILMAIPVKDRTYRGG